MLGALGDREPGGHAALWEMLLTFGRAFPDAWGAVDARKAVLPRLFAALRRAPAPTLGALLRSVGQRLLYSMCNSVAASHRFILLAGGCARKCAEVPVGPVQGAPAQSSTACADPTACPAQTLCCSGRRHACYGSAEASLPALLPFVAAMPRALLGPSPATLSQARPRAHCVASRGGISAPTSYICKHHAKLTAALSVRALYSSASAVCKAHAGICALPRHRRRARLGTYRQPLYPRQTVGASSWCSSAAHRTCMPRAGRGIVAPVTAAAARSLSAECASCGL